MTVWEVRPGSVDQVAMLVVPEADQLVGSMKRFGGDGTVLRWSEPPRLEPYTDKRKKRKPRGNISPFIPGALVLDARAAEALGPFLADFGQLLELDVEGTTEYFFNATNLVSCIDPEHSERRAGGTVDREAFIDESIPSSPAVFKDPVTARSRLYANAGGKEALERAAAANNVQGLVFMRAGL